MKKAAHYPGKPRPAPVSGPAALVLLLLVTGCAHEAARPARPISMPVVWPPVAPADPVRANAVLMRALGLVGTPYRFGGNTPEGGFDCSGLVGFVYRDAAALQLPRTSRSLATWAAPRVEPSGLAAADLVFFASGDAVDHVGIYVGEGRFVHAPSSGGTVRLDRLDAPYWRTHFSGAIRVLR